MRFLCMLCREVSTWNEGDPEIYGCPSCDSPHTPADADDTVTMTLTVHELRVLTIWASNWAEAIKDKPDCETSPQVIQGILDHIGTYTSAALSMRQEFADLRETFGEVTVYDIDGMKREDL